MAEKEYIDRGALQEIVYTRLKALEELYGAYDAYGSGYEECADRISEMPAADVAPVVHARWITEENTEGYRGDPHCTACKGILDDEAVYGHTPGVDSYFYCPLCGAKMDSGAE